MALPASQPLPGTDLAARLVQQLRTAEVRVPPYPAVAAALDRLVREGRASVSEITVLVASDSALAAAVLRHAAAAARGGTTPATLEAAVWKLGLEELSRVALATSVGAAAWEPGPLAVLRRDQWRRSLLAAMFCRELAARRGVEPDVAFLGGLLHDFGAVVVLACLEALAPLPVLPEATWRRNVDELHVEFGMVVAARWQLPEAITEAIASHHRPQACMRVHRSLVQLVAIVDQIIEILDRSPGGVGELGNVAGLDHDERLRIGALIPKVAEHMARFEARPTRATTSSVEALPSSIDGAWPADFEIEAKNGASFRACAIAPTMFAFRGPSALAPAWLAELTLVSPPDTLTLLAHVKSCEPTGDGDFLVTAQPFGLAGEDKGAWLRLVGRTRHPDAPRS